MYPFVSVIIPAFNEERYLPLCLASLRDLDYPSERMELILIDNGSTDSTVKIAAGEVDLLLSCPKVPVSKVRNFGVSQAKGEIFAFLDGDCTVSRDWLTAAVKTIGTEPIITGSTHLNPDDAPWLAKAWFCKPTGQFRPVHSLSCGNLIVPRGVFEQLGGFDESLATGEDTEFCARALKIARILENPEVRAYHHGIPRTIQQFFRREIWHGLGAFGTFRVNWFDPPLLGTFAFLLCHVVLVSGLIFAAAGHGAGLFVTGLFLLVALLLSTLAYRRRYIRNVSHGAQLFVLYYLYYAARSLSLFLLASKRRFYHNNKAEAHPVGEA